MEPAETRVFVSYSRADQALVTPIVQILRAVGGAVFHDLDSIPPGRRWRPVIEDSIDHAAVVLVFWCDHARTSDEVRQEWQRAIRAGKAVIPTLLDDTPLDSGLGEFQAIDLRALALVHATGPRNLLPGAEELARRRLLDARCHNHLRALDSRVALDVVRALFLAVRPAERTTP